MDADYLREALREDAELVGAPEPGLYERVIAARRRAAQRRLAALAAGLAALLVGISVPVSLAVLQSADGRQVAAPLAQPASDIYGGPTRGSLSDDSAFVEGVRTLPWTGTLIDRVPADQRAELPDSPLTTRWVVFAGEVTGGRWALVVGQNNGQPANRDAGVDSEVSSEIAGVWFAGPTGASPSQMHPVTLPQGIATQGPATLYDSVTGALVVVSAPGDSIELSARPQVASDASITRRYVEADVSDGVAVVAMDPSPYRSPGPFAVQYRVRRDGLILAQAGPQAYSDPEPTPAPELLLEYQRPPSGNLAVEPVGPSLEHLMTEQILAEYGVGPEEVHFLVHYSGEVPGGSRSQASVAVVSATFPSGAVLVRANWQESLVSASEPSLSQYADGGCSNELSPVGEPVAQRILAIRCDVGREVVQEDLPDPVSTLIVLAPSNLGAVSAATQLESGPFSVFLIGEGVAIAPFPAGARILTVADRQGTVLDEVRISSG